MEFFLAHSNDERTDTVTPCPKMGIDVTKKLSLFHLCFAHHCHPPRIQNLLRRLPQLAP